MRGIGHKYNSLLEIKTIDFNLKIIEPLLKLKAKGNLYLNDLNDLESHFIHDYKNAIM